MPRAPASRWLRRAAYVGGRERGIALLFGSPTGGGRGAGWWWRVGRTAARAVRLVVTGLSLHAGPLAGGRVVKVFGNNLAGVSDVAFGGVPATDVVPVSDSEVSARAPAHVAGVVDVLVTSPDGTSAVVSADRYSYLRAPTVTSVSPRSGPRGGGRSVTILGSRFTTSSTVKFEARAASHVVVLSAGRITARSPAHAAGLTNVRVSTPGGTSARGSADRFRYR